MPARAPVTGARAGMSDGVRRKGALTPLTVTTATFLLSANFGEGLSIVLTLEDLPSERPLVLNAFRPKIHKPYFAGSESVIQS